MPVRVLCPATSANLGPGFDALGIALCLTNAFDVEEADDFLFTADGADGLPSGEDNLVVRAFAATRQALGLDPVRGLRVHATVAVPPSRGLGSSATATVAGILAAETLAGAALSERARVELAARLDGHPDNTTPCLLGGLCVAVTGDRLEYQTANLAAPPSFVLATPADVELSTEAMRKVLPDQVPFADAVATAGRAAALAFALLGGHHAALASALDDRLHEPYRGPQIPGFHAVRAAAKEAGAYGTVISGSGPTLLALTAPDVAAAVGEAMVAAWSAAGVSATASVLPVDDEGARIA